MGYKDLPRRTASNKVLRDKAFNIAKNSKYYGYQSRLASLVYKCFDKKAQRNMKLINLLLTKEQELILKINS